MLLQNLTFFRRPPEFFQQSDNNLRLVAHTDSSTVSLLG